MIVEEVSPFAAEEEELQKLLIEAELNSIDDIESDFIIQKQQLELYPKSELHIENYQKSLILKKKKDELAEKKIKYEKDNLEKQIAVL